MAEHKEDLLSDSETWGLLTCEYRPYGIDDRSGAIGLLTLNLSDLQSQYKLLPRSKA